MSRQVLTYGKPKNRQNAYVCLQCRTNGGRTQIVIHKAGRRGGKAGVMLQAP